MRNRRWLCLVATLILALLFIPQTAFPQEADLASVADGETEETDSAPVSESENDYPIDYTYTSELITVYYHLYGNLLDDFVIVSMTNRSDDPAYFLVETEIDGYSFTSSDTVLAAPGETIEVRQNPRLIPESIEKLNAQRYANLVVRVTLLKEGEDELLLYDSSEILLYSRRDCAWLDGFTEQENNELLAVFVTPHDPAVEELLRRAADYTDSGHIGAGYAGIESDAEGRIWDWLEAIWQAEQDYDLTYVSTWVTFAPESIQRIRLPFEVLEQHGGNCIELSFLYASAVEALDLEAAVVFIPGHAYLAVRTDLVNAAYYFVETTLIDQADFQTAVDYGNSSWAEDLPAMEAGEDYYGWVTIDEAREWGVLPMPWR